jgi:hypothetical protein
MTININKLLVVAAGSLAFLAAVPNADAGRGSNLSRVTSAVNSNGSMTIRSELEKAERLLCPGCVDGVQPPSGARPCPPLPCPACWPPPTPTP